MKTTTSTEDKICRSCGAVGDAAIHTPGSIGIELILWCCFIVPGLIYSIWRHAKRGAACAQCHSHDLVAVGSPIGRKLMADLHPGVAVRQLAPLTPIDWLKNIGIAGLRAAGVLLLGLLGMTLLVILFAR